MTETVKINNKTDIVLSAIFVLLISVLAGMTNSSWKMIFAPAAILIGFPMLIGGLILTGKKIITNLYYICVSVFFLGSFFFIWWVIGWAGYGTGESAIEKVPPIIAIFIFLFALGCGLVADLLEKKQ